MAAASVNTAVVSCRDERGIELATVQIWSDRKPSDIPDIVTLPAVEAEAEGECALQLRERGRYVYKIKPTSGATDLTLRESPGVSRHQAFTDQGKIEPGDQCGLLTLKVVRVGQEDVTLATAMVEVASIKLGYREHYRGMLTHIAKTCEGLLLDSRATTQLRLATAWRRSRPVLEQQLEFLRHMLESASFRGAVDEVLRNPHRRLEDEHSEQPISRPFKPGKVLARQIGRAGLRVTLPEGHPLRTNPPHLASLPARIQVARRAEFLDTAENRFVKMVLVEFRDFLAEVSNHLCQSEPKIENTRLRGEVARLRGQLESTLCRGFLPDVSRPELLPLGSPVLQRKSGYRELLHIWLQFHVGAQMAWQGGSEVWQGGARNVATLYEYWLFFQLEALFREKFKCEMPLHALLLEKDNGLIRLKLERGVAMKTPVGGTWSKTARRPLKAEFQFNHKFLRNTDHRKNGSWTRGVQPDYTISIWPAEFDKDQAEECEALVHIHFDAKYRVENLDSMFGKKDEEDEAISDRSESVAAKPTAAKYSDLLKMHAYRDAIRRTAGAYVLYPGNDGDQKQFEEFNKKGFHEVLPGLGAFAIRPKVDGTADGMASLSKFLDEVIDHLSIRTTARERSSFHAAESYSIEEAPVRYGDLVLHEQDSLNVSRRALPPAEHHIVVAWYDNPAQLEWTLKSGKALVRLGDRPGTWHVPPEFASARHLLLHTHGSKVRNGLLRLKPDHPGYKVFTAADVIGLGYPGKAGGDIYAIFEVEEDTTFANQAWTGAGLTTALKAFDDRHAYRPKHNSHRSPDPRVLSLRELLTARA